MTATLPTRLKQHLRDLITSPTSPLSTKTSLIQQTLGYPLHLDPEWAMLWKELTPYFPAPETFVPYLASVLVAWCDAFLVWLEQEGDGEAVDRLLGSVRGGRVGLCLEISQGEERIARPVVSWHVLNAGFVITLPKDRPVLTHTVLYGFNTDFQGLFTSSPGLSSVASVSAPPIPGVIDDKEWAHLSLDSPEVHPIASKSKVTAAEEPGEDFLPEIAYILRPEELLKNPPYWMVVRQEGRTKVTVNGSHTGSLGVLESYLKRWCRGEPGLVDRPPIVTIRLQESAFGLGLLNETLTLETDERRGREVSALLVLVFVENVLGYTLLPMSGSAGSVWELRRTRGFK